MPTLFLYAIVVLLWGSSWLAIKYQLTVHASLAIGYRFFLASLVLFCFCMIKRISLRLTLKDHFWILLQSVCMFGFNYYVFYLATQYLASGLCSVIFSLLILMNILNAILFLKQRLHKPVLVGGLIGLAGMGLIFLKEIQSLDLSDHILQSVGLGILGTYLFSVGNIVAARNRKQGIPLLPNTAFGLFYGGLIMFVLAMLLGIPFQFDLSFQYIGSLLYLSVFSSVIAFLCYITLIERMGPDRSAYSALLFPVIALLLSTFLESYEWTVTGLAGFGCILGKNYLILKYR